MFSRAEDQSKVLSTYFLRLPPVKDLQFALAVGLEFGRTINPIQKNNGLTPLPTIYTLRDENLFRLNLQAIHTKAVKADDAELATAIWNDSAADVFHG